MTEQANELPGDDAIELEEAAKLGDDELIAELQLLVRQRPAPRLGLMLGVARLALKRRVPLSGETIEAMVVHPEASMRLEAATRVNLTSAQALALLEDEDGWVRGTIVGRYGDVVAMYDPGMWERLAADSHPGVSSALLEQDATPGWVLEHMVREDLADYEAGYDIAPVQELRFRTVAKHPNCLDSLIERLPAVSVFAVAPGRLVGTSCDNTIRRIVPGLCRSGFGGSVSAVRTLAALVVGDSSDVRTAGVAA